MVKLRADERGMTFIEGVIVTAIVGILALSTPALMHQVNRFFTLNRVRLELQREARTALSLITRNLRQGKSKTIKINRLNNTEPLLSRIEFEKQADAPLTIRYYQEGQKLVEDLNGVPRVISKNLRFLSFGLPDPTNRSKLTVTLTLEKPSFEGKKKSIRVSSDEIEVMN